MKKFLVLFATIFCIAVFSSKADVFTSKPAIMTEQSKNVIITFHADECNVAGLKNVNTDLYAHIGATINGKSWSKAPAWCDNSSKYVFKRVAANTFELNIGDIREYFSLAETDQISQVCIIARTADGSSQTSDYFLDVVPDGFYVSLLSSPSVPYMTTATTYTFSANATQPANLKIYVDGELKKEANDATELTYTQNFATVGQGWEVKVVGTKGSETKEAVMNLFYVAPSTAQNYPGGVPKQGAVKNSDGSVTFCLCAPQKSSVMLVGSWDDYKFLAERSMKYQDYNGYRYFWTTVNGLANDQYYMYYYLVDGQYKVGDPYAHLVLDYNSDKWMKDIATNPFPDRPEYPNDKVNESEGVMLAVYKGDLDDYNWKVNNFKIADPNSLVIYELLVRDFTGENKKADGTLRLAMEKIPYLKKLGVTAIELLPIMEFDGNNSWGYNTNFYMAPDKAYGSPKDYKEFIDLCHQNGIAVILDIVLNHTPGLAPWYMMYPKGSNPFYNASAPHDYSVYEDIRQEYQPWRNHWKDVLQYWLTTYKVDGFRFDLVKGLGDSNSYGSGTEAYNASRIKNMKELHSFIKEVNPNALHINENLAGVQEENDMAADGQYNWNKQTGTAAPYAKGNGGDLKYFMSKYCSRTNCSTVDYAESHDEPHIAYSAKNDSDSKTKSSTSLRAAMLGSVAGQMMMFPGPKMIWMFQELGDDQALPSDGRTDPKNVVWNYFDNAQNKRIYDAYEAMINLRKDNPELFSSSVDPYLEGFAGGTGARAIRLTYGDKEIVGFFNPSPTASATPTINPNKMNLDNYQLIYTNDTANPALKSQNGGKIGVTLAKGTFAVFATKNVAGVEEIIADEIGGKDVKVYGGRGEIVVVGDYNNVTVYNTAGMQMSSLKVAPGLYIVNVDGKAQKVIVK